MLRPPPNSVLDASQPFGCPAPETFSCDWEVRHLWVLAGSGKSPPTKETKTPASLAPRVPVQDLSSINWTPSPRLGIQSPRLGEAGSNRHAGGRAEHRDQPCRALANAPCQPRPRWPAIQQSTALGSNMLSMLPGDPMNYPISYEYIPFLHKSGRVVICHFAICN